MAAVRPFIAAVTPFLGETLAFPEAVLAFMEALLEKASPFLGAALTCMAGRVRRPGRRPRAAEPALCGARQPSPRPPTEQGPSLCFSPRLSGVLAARILVPSCGALCPKTSTHGTEIVHCGTQDSNLKSKSLAAPSPAPRPQRASSAKDDSKHRAIYKGGADITKAAC
eukprot:2064293-Rhodomonas_salina.1